MKFYKRFPANALEGMSELTLEQIGAYNLIIDLLYARDGMVPDDDGRVAHMLHLDPRTWRRMKKQLMAAGKIWITNDGLLNANGVDECRSSANLRSEIARRSVTHRWDLFRLAKQINGPSIRTQYERNTIKSKSKNTSTSLEAEQTEAGEDSGDNDESFGVVATGHSVATGALEAVVRAKGWTK